MTARVWHGDCIEVLRTLPAERVDAVITDPPYGLEFMGKEWDGANGFRRSLNQADAGRDNVFGRTSRTSPEYRTTTLYQQWCQQWAEECLRVMKPGAHLVAFGGTRTYHRLTCALEDAGFEIRDSLHWVYGQGFPKSLDVSKAIDKALRVEGTYGNPKSEAHAGWIKRGAMRGEEGHEGYQRPWMQDGVAVDRNARQYAPGSEDAARWTGWGTALKPAHEPIVLARKPLTGTVAANVLAHRTGALNIDATRVAHAGPADRAESEGKNRHATFGTEPGRNQVYGDYTMVPSRDYDGSQGRWPTNLVLTHSADCDGQCSPGCPVPEVDRQSGISKDGVAVRRNGVRGGQIGPPGNKAVGTPDMTYGGSGGASRFFPTFPWAPEDDLTTLCYTPKAPAKERPKVEGSTLHPTVKPLALMRWLVRLVCPPGGLVLDPFAGTGTTAEAVLLEGAGRRVALIEQDEEYLPMIQVRLDRAAASANTG